MYISTVVRCEQESIAYIDDDKKTPKPKKCKSLNKLGLCVPIGFRDTGAVHNKQANYQRSRESSSTIQRETKLQTLTRTWV